PGKPDEPSDSVPEIPTTRPTTQFRGRDPDPPTTGYPRRRLPGLLSPSADSEGEPQRCSSCRLRQSKTAVRRSSSRYRVSSVPLQRRPARTGVRSQPDSSAARLRQPMPPHRHTVQLSSSPRDGPLPGSSWNPKHPGTPPHRRQWRAHSRSRIPSRLAAHPAPPVEQPHRNFDTPSRADREMLAPDESRPHRANAPR